MSEKTPSAPTPTPKATVRVETHEEQMRRYRVNDLNELKAELKKFGDEARSTKARVVRLVSKLLDAATDRMGCGEHADDAAITAALEAIAPAQKCAVVGTEALVEIADRFGRVLAMIRAAEGLDKEEAAPAA